MDETVFQKIYDELNEYLLPGWEKLIVYLEYGVATYSFSFYIKVGNEYINCWDLKNALDSDIRNSFKNIDEFVSLERNKSTGKWSNMTMIVKNDGDMHTDFDYTNLTEGLYQFKKNWKKKYLV